MHVSRHHLLLVLSLLPSCLLVVADEGAGSRSRWGVISSRSSSSSNGLRALQNTTDMAMDEEEEDHDHDGDGVQDHDEEDHMEEDDKDEGDHYDENAEFQGDADEPDDHHDHDHDHDEVEFEWAGVFHLEPGKSYVLTLKPPSHDDDHDDHGDEDHEGHDHGRFLQAAEEEENHDDHDHDGDGIPDHTDEAHNDDHDHDGDGVADHAAEDHSVLLDEEYHFFLAVVPVEEHGQEGIDQAMSALNMDVIIEVEGGATITPTADNVYELLFPAEKPSGMIDPAVDMLNTTDLAAVSARAGHIAENGVMTVIVEVPASETKADFVFMLPGKPSEVAGSDKIIAESETGEKLVPEDVRVLSSSEVAAPEETTTSAEGATSAGIPSFQIGSAVVRTMTAFLMGGMLML